MLARDKIFETLGNAISARTATVGIMGLGYVGLPLATASANAGFPTVGLDVDAKKVGQLNAGISYIDAVSNEELSRLVAEDRFRATAALDELSLCDVIVICVPTPLTRHREPNLLYVENSAKAIAERLKRGQLVILESTSFPGTTNEVVKPLLERTGLKSGVDFFVGFSPEREDPGNPDYHTATIPKIVAGDGENASALMEMFYGAVVKKVVLVSSPEIAEAAKITENIFRAVNIALVNELKLIYQGMGIDIWEVINAASTKPFGYMPFFPGPGLGGHCIPIDPFYLTWKSREFGVSTRFIELAGEINLSMPHYVVKRVEEALDRRLALSLGSSRVLIIGIAYKRNVADTRESPSLKLIELLEKRGARVDFHDPHVSEIPLTREHPELAGRKSMALRGAMLASYNVVLVATDHDAVDYALIGRHVPLIVDTRNVFSRKGLIGDHIVKA
jgi:UDP-N-acetyl-D-glucosamine dehydrogenase